MIKSLTFEDKEILSRNFFKQVDFFDQTYSTSLKKILCDLFEWKEKTEFDQNERIIVEKIHKEGLAAIEHTKIYTNCFDAHFNPTLFFQALEKQEVI